MKNNFYHSSKQFIFIGLLVLGTGLISCGSKSGEDGILSGVTEMFSSEISSETIKKALQMPAFSDSSVSNAFIRTELEKLYEENGNKPLWLSGKSISQKGTDAIEAIGQLKLEGLNPEKYQLSRLKEQQNKKSENEDDLAAFDILLSHGIISAARDLTFGVLDPANIDKEWHSDNDSLFNVKALISADSSSKSNVLNSFRPANPRYVMMINAVEKWENLKSDSAYKSLKELVKNGDKSAITVLIQKEIQSQETDTNLIKTYQYLNHLSTTGQVNDELLQVLQRSPDKYIEQLHINMERMRWLPNQLDGQYVWVSIPQAEVDYYKDGNNLFHNRTIVGSKTNRTPSISKPMENIVICPPWGLPLSIVGKEYGGRIPSKYQVFKGGKRVPNGMVNASNYRQFSVRQPPGPSAALGYVKFNLPNKWDIYLHDTPNRNLFGNKLRYMSHGCIRVKDPRVLASIILENKGVDIDSINSIIKTNRTTFINTDKIPVYISYLTANADSTMKNILYLNDPYKKDSVLNNKLLALFK